VGLIPFGEQVPVPLGEPVADGLGAPFFTLAQVARVVFERFTGEAAA